MPLNINRNREKLQQRRTWQYGGGFYRISHLEMNGEAFVTISTCDTAEYAAIGLMEEIEAIPLDTSAERMRQMIRCALDAEPGGQ